VGANESNIIAGNGTGATGAGVSVETLAESRTTLQNNTIGLNAAGAPLGNGGEGVLIRATIGVTVGGAGANQGNTIGSNGAAGIELRATSTRGVFGTTIQGQPHRRQRSG
jgi:hypothetical protein